MRLTPILVLLAIGAQFGISSTHAETAPQASLQAGAARADITPDPQLVNWVLLPPRPYGAVNDPLFVRALVLSDGSTRVALLVWDLLDAREYAVARVREAVAQQTGIPSTHIVVHATHNHSGPKSEMGPERDSAREGRASRPAQQNQLYRAWADQLVQTCVQVIQAADRARQPVSLTIGRAYAGEWLFNRRPIRPDGKVQSLASPPDPYVLAAGLRFGALDPTLTVLGLRAASGQSVATLFHLPMHAVAIYPSYKGVSADWPGPILDRLKTELGGEAFFLQGCAGDIVPFRRGFEAVATMTQGLSSRAMAAEKAAHPVKPGRLRTARATVGLPATETTKTERGLETLSAEVQIVTYGDLALVTLPGEPLNDLSRAIVEQSPFAHTLVLGYTNGRGAGYIALPGNKVKGGYEMTVVGAATDEAGQFLVAAALRLLQEHADQ